MSIKPNESYTFQNNDVYEWIRILKEDPDNHHIQTKLVQEYDSLVRALARRFSRGAVVNEDFVQVGMVGLLGALERFDPNFGKSFESFAVPTIIGEIKRYIRDNTWSVHVPRRIKELSPRIKRAAEKLTEKLHRSPQIAEIANHLEVSEEEVLETIEINRSYQALSVDRSIGFDQEDRQSTLLDLLGETESGYKEIDQKLLLRKAFQALSDREALIIECVFFKQKSQKETGEAIGISQMHVSRLQRQALQKMKEAIRMGFSEAL